MQMKKRASIFQNGQNQKEIDEAIIKRMEPLHRIISELRQYKAKNKMAQNAQIPSITISLEEGLSPDLLDEIRK